MSDNLYRCINLKIYSVILSQPLRLDLIKNHHAKDNIEQIEVFQTSASNVKIWANWSNWIQAPFRFVFHPSLLLLNTITIKNPSQTNRPFSHYFPELNQVQLAGTIEHEVCKLKSSNALRFFLKTRNSDGSQWVNEKNNKISIDS